MNIIFQYWLDKNGVGKNHDFYNYVNKVVDISKNYFKEYANMHNAEYFFSNERTVKTKSNYFEVCRIYLDPYFDKFDKLLFVDIDVIPKNMKENIFNLDVKDVAGWPEHNHYARKDPNGWKLSIPLEDRFKKFGAPIVKPKTVENNIRIINTGVMIWTRDARIKARKLFDNHEDYFNYKNPILDKTLKNVGHSTHCIDQPFLNVMFNKYNFDVKELGIEWNRTPTKDEDYPCNFAHYTGNNKKKIIELYG
jgi:lipopolysaccharide biosynthesis glycosyltransferase